MITPVPCPCARTGIKPISAYAAGCRHGPARAAAVRAIKHRRAGLWQPCVVDPIGSIRRLRALAAIGRPSRDAAAALGWTVNRVGILRAGAYPHHLYRRTADAVTAHYEAVCMTPGPDRRLRAVAARNGWYSSLGWDGINIDDPGAVPDLGLRSRGRVDLADAEHLRRAGMSDDEVAARFGVAPASVYRARQRASRNDQAGA